MQKEVTLENAHEALTVIDQYISSHLTTRGTWEHLQELREKLMPKYDIELVGKPINQWNSREDGNEEERNSKTIVDHQEHDLKINGELFKGVELGISYGQVYSAHAYHKDFTQEEGDMVHRWWYQKNFG